MECVAVKLTAACHSFSGIGRGLFRVLRQILNCSLTSLRLGRGVGYFLDAIGYPPLGCWTTDRIIFFNAVHARLPKGHEISDFFVWGKCRENCPKSAKY